MGQTCGASRSGMFTLCYCLLCQKRVGAFRENCSFWKSQQPVNSLQSVFSEQSTVYVSSFHVYSQWSPPETVVSLFRWNRLHSAPETPRGRLTECLAECQVHLWLCWDRAMGGEVGLHLADPVSKRICYAFWLNWCIQNRGGLQSMGLKGLVTVFVSLKSFQFGTVCHGFDAPKVHEWYPEVYTHAGDFIWPLGV